MRVLFWGTPDFATPPLHALLGEGFEVTGVVTQPDKPTGRSRSTVTPSPVKQIALEEKLPVFQPEKLNDPEFLELMELMAPDVSVVVAYGKLLPTRLIELPAMAVPAVPPEGALAVVVVVLTEPARLISIAIVPQGALVERVKVSF